MEDFKKRYLTSDEIGFIVEKVSALTDSTDKVILMNGLVLQFCVDLDSFHLKATSCNLVYDECIKRGIKAQSVYNYDDLLKALEFEDGLSRVSTILADESFKEIMNKAKEVDKA